MIWIYNLNITVSQNISSCNFSRAFNVKLNDFFVFNV